MTYSYGLLQIFHTLSFDIVISSIKILITNKYNIISPHANTPGETAMKSITFWC